jgi:hypothetical protein
LIAAAALAAPRPDVAPATAPQRSGLVIALDLSGSIETAGPNAVHRALDELVAEAQEGGAGLVLFSDVAEEALPPGTPARELGRFLRYFPRPQGKSDDDLIAPNPWTTSFSSGTAISRGLETAREALPGGGRIVLISDLEDAPADLGTLKDELNAIARRPDLQLDVIELPSLFASQNPPSTVINSAVGDVRRLINQASLEKAGMPIATPATRSGATTRQRTPGLLIALAIVVAAVLALFLRVGAPLRWRVSRA